MGDGSMDDEEFLDPGEPLPAPDRLWRHPAEMGAAQAAANIEARRAMGRRWPTMIVSFIAGAAVVGAAWLLSEAPEQPIESVTMAGIQAESETPIIVEGPSTEDQWAAELAELNHASVVTLDLEGPVENQRAHGFLYRGDGHVITSAHAVAGASTIWATLADGHAMPATVVATDSVSGVAVLKINSTELPVATFSERALSIAIGDRMISIASDSETDDQEIRTVAMLGTDRVSTMANGDVVPALLHLSGELSDTWSGAPVIDDRGGVVGMAITGVDGTRHAVPAARVRAVANDLIDEGTTEHRSWLGVHVAAGLSESLKQERGLYEGVLLVRVFADTPAAEGGLQIGDIIVAVDNTPIKHRDAFGQLMRAYDPGDEITIVVNRLIPPAGPTATNDEPYAYEPQYSRAVVTLGAQSRR